MGKIHILNILVCIAILFVIHNLVRLAVRLKKAGKGNWTFRVSWKDVVGIGIKYLFWLAVIWFVAYIIFDTFQESMIELKYWLPFIIVVLADIIDLIDSSIKTKEKEADF